MLNYFLCKLEKTVRRDYRKKTILFLIPYKSKFKLLSLTNSEVYLFLGMGNYLSA